MTDIPDQHPGDAVAVAYLHQDVVSSSWHHSIIELLAHDLATSQRVFRGGWVAMHCGTGGLVEARNQAVETFLREKAADWLFWVDTDMGFPATVVDTLMEVADPETTPVVGALCFSQRELEADGMGGYRTAATPTIMDWTHVDGQAGFAVRWNYERGKVVRCAGTGSACILIHRSAFERVAERFGPIWYDRVPNASTGQLIGEDLSFCMRLGALEIPVHVHAGVEASHHKGIWLTEETYVRQCMAEAMIQAQAEQEPSTNGTPVNQARENARRRLKAVR